MQGAPFFMEKHTTPNNLKLLRLLYGNLCQKHVAYKIGISQVAYHKMENGELIPSAITIEKLSAFYEIDVTAILYLSNEKLKKRLFKKRIKKESTLKTNLKMGLDTFSRKLKIASHRITKRNN